MRPDLSAETYSAHPPVNSPPSTAGQLISVLVNDKLRSVASLIRKLLILASGGVDFSIANKVSAG
jgi:hypothetical protein